MSDTGRYFCQACGWEKFLGRLHMTAVGEAFAKPNVTKIPDTPISTYGGKVILECDVSKGYYVRWYKVGLDGDLNTKDYQEVKKNIQRKTVVIRSVTEKDDGIYVCEIRRYIMQYVANATITIKSQEPRAPSFSAFNVSSEMILAENGQISVNYSVSGIPSPNITWFRSKNGLHIEKIADCPSASSRCTMRHRRKEKITTNAFNLLQVEYPTDDKITYTCHARNHLGNMTKSFLIQVYTKPQLKRVKLQTLKYYKEMQLNCSVEKVNPKITNFTWQHCDPENAVCDLKNDRMWKHVDEDYVTSKEENSTFSLVIHDQYQRRIRYRCKAKNILGTDEMSFEIIKVEEPFEQVKRDSPLILFSTAIPVGIFCLSFILVVLITICKRMKIYGGLYIFSYPPMQDYIDQLDYSKDIREQIRKLPYVPEWEFPREKLSLQSELGKGEFGSVWLAYANGIMDFRPRDVLKHKLNRTRLSVFIRALRSRNNSYVGGKEVTAVAVKKLKDDSDREKLIDLQSELKILIHVGEHENIVNLIGACTKGTSYNLWIILEYCPNGDLRSFLRHSRSHYDENETSLATDLSVELGPRDLINFALQIAKGMEFLNSRKVIHRDLAARNVLLGREYVAKVADFGLARDVYKYQKYVKKSCTLLPLKWMAIESIQYSIFTEKTDVWSFGVVLWEMFTLGQTPYPGVSNLDVFTFLAEGQRMASPARSPQKVDELMKQCWESNPNNRPSFTMVVNMLEEFVACEGIFESVQDNYQNYDLESDFHQMETLPCGDNGDSLQKQGYLQRILVEDEKEPKK